MKITIANMIESSGISKKTNAAFEIKELNILVPISPVTSPNYVRKPMGLGLLRHNIDERFFAKLKSFFELRFMSTDKPVLVDVEVITTSEGPLITGFTEAFLKQLEASKTEKAAQ